MSCRFIPLGQLCCLHSAEGLALFSLRLCTCGRSRAFPAKVQSCKVLVLGTQSRPPKSWQIAKSADQRTGPIPIKFIRPEPVFLYRRTDYERVCVRVIVNVLRSDSGSNYCRH